MEAAQDRHMTKRLAVVLTTILFAGCTTESAGTDVSGQAVYRDAATDHTGASSEPAAPPPQGAQIRIVVKGAGQIPDIDPQCALDPAGQFEARYVGTLDVSDGDLYAATVASGSGQIATPSGCEVPNLTVGVVTDIVVRGELDATTTNCDTYCSASARADAEAQCGASATAAACRAQFEEQASAQCAQTCTTEASKIVAEVSLAASVLGDIDADALRAAALGDLTANLTFDHMEGDGGGRL
jgi:hypothetical protein